MALLPAILGDDAVVTWGDSYEGGDSSAVQNQLKNVQQVQAFSGSFAAILADGSVVAWGDADFVGDSGEVHDLLKNVQQIQASEDAFAAVVGGGFVTTWGRGRFEGDSSAVLPPFLAMDRSCAGAMLSTVGTVALCSIS